MTEIYLHFLFAHYGLYGNAPVLVLVTPPDHILRFCVVAPLLSSALSVVLLVATPGYRGVALAGGSTSEGYGGVVVVGPLTHKLSHSDFLIP